MRMSMVAVTLAGAVCAGAAGNAATWDSGGSPLAQRKLLSGEGCLHNGHFSDAIALATRAIEIAPDFGYAYLRRAEWELAAGKYAEAEADASRFAAMHPDARAAPFVRATIALFRGDGQAATVNLTQAAALPYRSDERGLHITYAAYSNAIYLADRSIAEALLGQADQAAADMQRAIDTNSERPWYVLNHYCWTAAVAGQLDLAELACQEAIRRETRDDGHVFDSLGFVHLKMRRWRDAVADYTQALAENEDAATSLYGRGVARIASGDLVGGKADVAKSREGEHDIDGIMNRLGAPTAQTLSK